mmetsp:Transcript_1710/g.5032  ORF Transcript_1710/g.5032 Transcript_1710/m.5032 type:complete len:212 (+) Transcript_1710:33-668(+)
MVVGREASSTRRWKSSTAQLKSTGLSPILSTSSPTHAPAAIAAGSSAETRRRPWSVSSARTATPMASTRKTTSFKFESPRREVGSVENRVPTGRAWRDWDGMDQCWRGGCWVKGRSPMGGVKVNVIVDPVGFCRRRRESCGMVMGRPSRATIRLPILMRCVNACVECSTSSTTMASDNVSPIVGPLMNVRSTGRVNTKSMLVPGGTGRILF